MDLKKIIDKKDWAAKYMIDEITHICTKFEKRDPGSNGEKQACEYMAKVLKEDCGCDRVSVESFKENPRSFYGWIYITITLAFIAALIYLFAPQFSFIGAVLIIIGLILCVLQFGIYKKAVDKLFPEKTGHNVTALKKCTGETKRRIIFNGHPDATWEWPVNYALGGVGFEGHAIICFVGAFYYLGISIANIFSDAEILTKLGLYGLIFFPFWFGLYFMVNYKRVVDGANDNLSGCYMGIALLKALQDEGIELENTELGVVLTGSEEAGLRGAKAWCEAHKGEFDDVPTYIYSYDTIYDPEFLMVNYRDLNATVKSDKALGDLFMDCAKELDIKCTKGMVPPMGGATDAAAFAQAGMRATGITGLDHNLKSYYHTRKDTYTNMNEKGLGECFAITAKVLEKVDDGIEL